MGANMCTCLCVNFIAIQTQCQELNGNVSDNADDVF